MKDFPKILESNSRIRFQDCDPLNHLNNSKYLDYLINAREDQLIAHYDLNIFENAKKTGTTWVVGSHQIAYVRPANVMETVTIQSQLIQYGNKQLLVEIRMYNEEKTELKAVMWSSFVHFNVLTGKAHEHNAHFMSLFENVQLPVNELDFNMRVKSLRMAIVS
ncbi:thioesterase-like superfamily protein [Kordia sp. SMS9]|uniref:acyl-CoA thioesterase n=1 Tax=Kordia sp. SMS9 TaxID=2282170 RepID=UPI000E0DDFFD|nr:acyl-CoA thioesterase [Kordia sp. SMS9]AXG71010.1 thioesterase-like superfamily protein [Kordia sp. SMS9]